MTDPTVASLLEFGIDGPLAHEAAKRHPGNVNAAVDWCFGAGASWKPEDKKDELPNYGSAQHIEHRPPRFVSPAPDRTGTPPPPIPPRRLPPTPGPIPVPSPASAPRLAPAHGQDGGPPALTPYIPLGSNNPFLSSTTSSSSYTPRHMPSATTTTAIAPYVRPSSMDDPGSYATVPTGRGDEDDEDEALQRAIRLSQGEQLPFEGTSSVGAGPTRRIGAEVGGGGGGGLDVDMDPEGESTDVDSVDGERSARADRERSTRATAPPPSPEGGSGGEGGSRGVEGRAATPYFGPSNKEEQGATALVALGQSGSFDNPIDASKEDEDLNRAIQDSLMTASFHSQSGAAVERPMPLPRRPGAPLIFLSESGQSTYAANFLQAMYAVPQLRQAVQHSIAEGSEAARYGALLLDLQRLFALAETEEQSFIPVDELLKDMRGGSVPTQLPPETPVGNLQDATSAFLRAVIANTKQHKPEMRGEIWEGSPENLVCTTLYPPVNPLPSYVFFTRAPEIASELHAQLASILWRGAPSFDVSGMGGAGDASGDATVDAKADDKDAVGPPECIVEFADVMCVQLRWGYGAQRELWDIQERVVLDRYAKENQQWAAQIRAQQGVAKGELRRLKEKIDALSMYQGQNLQDSIATVIKHYDIVSPAKPSVGADADADTIIASEEDAVRSETRAELRAKLDKILAALRRKTEALELDVKREEAAAGNALFEVPDEDKNRHVYDLRAVLMHDGALVAGRHLYAYVKADEGGWWKVQDHEIEPTTLEAIKTDRTGLFMDGGPYFLEKLAETRRMYSRVGPRPPRPVSATRAAPVTASGQAQGPSETHPESALEAEADADAAAGVGPAEGAAQAVAVGGGAADSATKIDGAQLGSTVGGTADGQVVEGMEVDDATTTTAATAPAPRPADAEGAGARRDQRDTWR